MEGLASNNTVELILAVYGFPNILTMIVHGLAAFSFMLKASPFLGAFLAIWWFQSPTILSKESSCVKGLCPYSQGKGFQTRPRLCCSKRARGFRLAGKVADVPPRVHPHHHTLGGEYLGNTP